MTPTEKTTLGSTVQPNVPWGNFVRFIRQLSHDLRNQLNAAELQSALIGEITTDPELKSELGRLRELVSKLGTTLQSLSSSVAEPRPARLSYSATDFISDLRKKIAENYPKESQHLKWQPITTGAVLEIDPILVEWAVIELFDNAFRHSSGAGEISVSTAVEGEQFTLALREPKREKLDDPSQWSIPLRSITHGHYHLGLHRARQILEAHGGNLTAEFDPESATLTSRIILPCSLEKN
ncbi:MAG: two-component system, OmpR family, sensor histidine kinase SenX3 [Verrucomicrobiota bacterium]